MGQGKEGRPRVRHLSVHQGRLLAGDLMDVVASCSAYNNASYLGALGAGWPTFAGVGSVRVQFLLVHAACFRVA